MPPDPPVVTFLSDYGLEDEWVGVVHGVIARLCPGARVLDITHGVPRHDVRRGALLLRSALPFVPPGVHLAVVDPEVGGTRRAVALRAGDGRLLVGPDNGLLTLAASDAGGVVEAVDVGHSPWRLEPVSATFHGRDVFAPVAARLAAGEPVAAAGSPLDPDELARLELPRPRREDGALVAHVLTLDRFGNAALDATHEDAAAWGVPAGARVRVERSGSAPATARMARTFADAGPGELVLYEDAARLLALAVNRGSAAEHLGLRPDDELRLVPA
ncbi:MAG: SAM-dependent chlorinase/fluorinase [Solirubrobacteraceae bacterium]